MALNATDLNVLGWSGSKILSRRLKRHFFRRALKQATQFEALQMLPGRMFQKQGALT